MNKVLLVDDHAIILDGLEAILSTSPKFEIVGRAHNGLDAIRLAKTFLPDIILMDIEMPVKNGIEATLEIKRKHPLIKVLGITMYNDSSFIQEMLDAGADGYILKNSGREDLLQAIERVLAGEKYISVTVLNAFLKKHQTSGIGSPKENPKINLTDRELELVKLVSKGLTNKEIGNELSISSRTVETHRSNLMRKLNVNNVSGIIQYSIKNNLL